MPHVSISTKVTQISLLSKRPIVFIVQVLFQYLEQLRVIKIESDVGLIEKVKASFSIPGKIILQKYLDAWVEVSPPEIRHIIKMKVHFCIVNSA